MAKGQTGSIRKNKNKSRQLDVVATPEYEEACLAARAIYQNDFVRFCRDKLTIIDKVATSEPRKKLDPNDCQLALVDLIEKIGDLNELRTTKLAEIHSDVRVTRFPIEIVVLKARKVGVSTILEARAFWKSQMFPSTNCLVMAHERPAAQNIANIAQRFDTFWIATEDYPIFKVPLARKSDDLLEWKEWHDSRLVVETAGTKGGGGSSRSFTYQFVHMSEVAFFPKDSPQMAAALTARAVNHETFLESTANGTGNLFHDEWENAMWYHDVEKYVREGRPLPKEWNGKFRFFWPWFQQSENCLPLFPEEEKYIAETLDDEEKYLVENFKLSWGQLAWRRREITGPCSKQTMMSAVAFFKQEHPATPEEAFVSKSSSLFDVKKLNHMMSETRKIEPKRMGFLIHDPEDPLCIKFVEGGRYIAPEFGEPMVEGAQFVVWEEPNPNEAYVIGADAAEGLEHGDWSVVSVFSRTNGTAIREVARFRAKTHARELGEIANYLGLLYNEAFIVGERNAPGNSMMEKLVDLEYPNLYHSRNIEVVGEKMSRDSFTAGFRTTHSSKPMLCMRGVEGVRDDAIILRHPDAIREWKTFSRIDTKYGAPEGYNDDTVMADLLAYFGSFEAPPLRMDQRAPVDKVQDETPQEYERRYFAKMVEEKKKRAVARNIREQRAIRDRLYVRSLRDILN